MVISAYQVNNVLRVYGDQLRQGRLSNRPKQGNLRSPDTINISAEAKRKAIVNRVAETIVDRIIHEGPNDDVEREVFQRLEDEYGGQLAVVKRSPSDLIFKEIDENGETIHSLSVEDSKFLRYKLEEITKQAIVKNMV
jgi:hypothetical protein